ncbi:MAG: alpha/beta hydrolase [Solirubrobacteraceae bacterium MAG38_C4-C5]|nr:alpha/beta hydrolase [Candidatus Siliceabacter maunaloa]
MTGTDHVLLSDGRRLAFTATGPADGRPVVVLHGGIGVPLGRCAALDATLTTLDVRWIAVSRPGFEGSDPAPGRTLRSLAPDVDALADRLGLDHFAVLGISAGGPYALACAHALGRRITAVAITGSPSPLGPPHATRGAALRYRLPLRALAADPEACTAVARTAARLLARHPGLVARAMAAGASGPDRGTLADPRAAAASARSVLACAQATAPALAEDYLIGCRPWGFDLAGIEVPVQLWHGMRDRLVPVEHALQLAIGLPRCHAALAPDEGHFFLRRRLPEVLDGLLAACATSVPTVSCRGERVGLTA